MATNPEPETPIKNNPKFQGSWKRLSRNENPEKKIGNGNIRSYEPGHKHPRRYRQSSSNYNTLQTWWSSLRKRKKKNENSFPNEPLLTRWSNSRSTKPLKAKGSDCSEPYKATIFKAKTCVSLCSSLSVITRACLSFRVSQACNVNYRRLVWFFALPLDTSSENSRMRGFKYRAAQGYLYGYIRKLTPIKRKENSKILLLNTKICFSSKNKKKNIAQYRKSLPYRFFCCSLKPLD